jgi:hypothetical protein
MFELRRVGVVEQGTGSQLPFLWGKRLEHGAMGIRIALDRKDAIQVTPVVDLFGLGQLEFVDAVGVVHPYVPSGRRLPDLADA